MPIISLTTVASETHPAGSGGNTWLTSASADKTIGLAFSEGVTVPKDATIVSAVINQHFLVQAAEGMKVTPKLLAEDDATTSAPFVWIYAGSTYDGVEHDFTSVGTGVFFLDIDITSSVQSVVNRAGWVSGNHVGVQYEMVLTGINKVFCRVSETKLEIVWNFADVAGAMSGIPTPTVETVASEIEETTVFPEPVHGRYKVLYPVGLGHAVGAWESLLAVQQRQSVFTAEWEASAPEACPNDGTPLLEGPNGDLVCPFDEWVWSGHPLDKA